MNDNNQNLNNNAVVQPVIAPIEKNKGTGTIWLLTVALIISGGIFKGVSLLITMVNDAGGQATGMSTAIKIMDILPFVAWGLAVPSLIFAIVRTLKNKKK